MNEQNESCTCSRDKLIFSCSGAADVGELADRAARELTRQGIGKMFCLAGVGGDVEPILDKTRNAKGILVIDGCQVACAKKSLDRAGIENYQHMQLGDLGYEKGNSPASSENVAEVIAKSREYNVK